MGILDETGFIERLSFFNGQRLFASDLQGVEAFHREMRWLHNKSLHQPGIGAGFAVTGKRDDREVRVGPGYAIDSQGREIVLTRERVQPIPTVASETDGKSIVFDLAVSYPGDELLEATESREGICLRRGVVRLREEPVLCWIRLHRDTTRDRLVPEPDFARGIEDGLWIVLARIEVLQCRLRQDVSLAERPNARPDCRPYIACGHQAVDWEEDDFNKLLYHLTGDIDTSSAGFLTTPCYSVRLDGKRVSSNGETLDFLVLDTPPTIIDPKPDRFSFQLFVWVFRPQNQAPIEGVRSFHDFKRRKRGTPREPGEPKQPWDIWKAVWMGVE